MKNNISTPPIPNCEAVKSYAPGTIEREVVIKEYRKTINQIVDIPMWINGKNIKSKKINKISPPHDHQRIVGQYYEGNASHVNTAITSALKAKSKWEDTSWEDRAAIFLKAAELLSGPYRQKMNIATMIGQSKNIFQAEIDAACELIDFLRFNVKFLHEIYSKQPDSSKGIWNKIEYRPLEGFVFAITPRQKSCP